MKTVAQQWISAGVLCCRGTFVDSSQTHALRCLNLNSVKKKKAIFLLCHLGLLVICVACL